MFKKLLASIGKGAANIDLRLDKNTYQAGEHVTGHIFITGGDVEQTINSIEVGLFMNISHQHESSSHHIATIPVDGTFTIGIKEQKQVAFRYQLPYTLPISSHNVSFYFDTHLDIRVGMDKKDIDYITIRPAQYIENIFQAMKSLGFQETHHSGTLDGHAQEFEFYPTTKYNGQIQEVEMKFALEDGGVYVWMEVDVQKGFREKEIQQEFFLVEQVLEREQDIATMIENKIEEALEARNGYHSHQEDYHQHQHQRYHHASHDSHAGSSPFGMIGGVAAGIAGGMLLNEAIEHFTENDDEEKDESDNEDNDGFLHEFFNEEEE